MMTAAEAKTRLESRNFHSTIKQLTEIEAAINEAIDKGNGFIYYPHIVSIEVENRLKELLYKVQIQTTAKTTHISFL